MAINTPPSIPVLQLVMTAVVTWGFAHTGMAYATCNPPAVLQDAVLNPTGSVALIGSALPLLLIVLLQVKGTSCSPG